LAFFSESNKAQKKPLLPALWQGMVKTSGMLAKEVSLRLVIPKEAIRYLLVIFPFFGDGLYYYWSKNSGNNNSHY
jgi:hypothetical protein